MVSVRTEEEEVASGVLMPGLLESYYTRMLPCSPSPHRCLAVAVNSGSPCLQHPISGKVSMLKHKCERVWLLLVHLVSTSHSFLGLGLSVPF